MHVRHVAAKGLTDKSISVQPFGLGDPHSADTSFINHPRGAKVQYVHPQPCCLSSLSDTRYAVWAVPNSPLVSSHNRARVGNTSDSRFDCDLTDLGSESPSPNKGRGVLVEKVAAVGHGLVSISCVWNRAHCSGLAGFVGPCFHSQQGSPLLNKTT